MRTLIFLSVFSVGAAFAPLHPMRIIDTLHPMASSRRLSSPTLHSRVKVQEIDNPVDLKPPTCQVALAPLASKLDGNIFKLNKFIVDSVYVVISTLYANNDFARFYVLETVARVPYFAYLSVMHLRETFGKREPGN